MVEFAIEAACFVFGLALAANLAWGLVVIAWALFLQLTGRRK